MTSTFPHRVVLGALSIMSSGWSATAHADFQTASVYPSDGVTKDRFGDAVALASSLALVGAPGTGLHVGSVYILNVTNPSLPIELGRLFAPDITGNDNFGDAIALEGTLALIGAPNRRPSPGGNSCGGVYFMDFTDPQNPVDLGVVAPANGASTDDFGKAVAVHGDLAIIGSPGFYQSNKQTGAVYIFRTSTRQLLSTFVPTLTGGATYLQLGTTVDIHASIAIAGAPLNRDAGPNSGAVYLINLDDPAHPVTSKILALDAATSDFFGTSVALGDGIAAVGSPMDDYPGGFDVGSVYLLNSTTGAQITKLFAPTAQENAHFGGYVRIEGDILVVGSPNWTWTEYNNPGCGTIDLFDISDPSLPVHITSLLVGGIKSWDALGSMVDISGSRIVAGVPVGTNQDLVATGAAYIFDMLLAPPGCTGNINGDGFTNASDFVILAGNFGASVPANTAGDLNGDGVVNASDFVILAGDFGCGN